MLKTIKICALTMLTTLAACDFNSGGVETEEACKADSDCNDNLGCTEQYCSDETHTCVKIDTCEDDLTCTPGGCVSMDAPDGGTATCTGSGDDGLSCTTDACSGTTWTHTSTCSSGQTCTASGCVTPTCTGSGDDGLSCTTDACSGTTWTHTSTCSSGQTCTSTGCVTPPTIHEINCVDLGAASGKTRITIKGDVYGAVVGTVLPGTPTYVSLAADTGPGPSWLSVPNPDVNYRFSIDVTTHLVTTTVDALETVQGFNFYVTNAPVAGGAGDVRWFKLLDYTVTGNCYKNAGGDKIHITP